MAAAGDSVTMNEVDYLLNHQFSSMTLEEKLEVKRLGTHRPNVQITQKDKRQNRKFCVFIDFWQQAILVGASL